jgi:hypothetical protein
MRRTLLVLALLGTVSLPSRADDPGPFTASQLKELDRRGYLTPTFAAAARELIEARQAQRDGQAEQAQLKESLPALEEQASTEESKVKALKEELARYDHPDDADLAALQAAMKNPAATPDEQMALAQAYVWTYPMSPHATEAQQDVEQIQKKLADQAEAQKEADAARAAAQGKLLQRVHARDLSLEEWRAFLQDKTQAEVTGYLGHPNAMTDDYWTYAGAWTVDPSTNLKAGLQVTFNGGRVLSVAPVPAQ